MTVSIAKLAPGQHQYYLRYYYNSSQEAYCVWLPTAAAKALGLHGRVSAQDLKALFEGFDPQGNPLVQNAGKRSRRPAWDYCASQPKEASVYSVMAPIDIQKVWPGYQLTAITEMVHNLEQNAAFVRTGTGGCRLEPASLLVCVVYHETSRSRPPDPQMHSHILILPRQKNLWAVSGSGSAPRL